VKKGVGGGGGVGRGSDAMIEGYMYSIPHPLYPYSVALCNHSHFAHDLLLTF